MKKDKILEQMNRKKDYTKVWWWMLFGVLGLIFGTLLTFIYLIWKTPNPQLVYFNGEQVEEITEEFDGNWDCVSDPLNKLLRCRKK